MLLANHPRSRTKGPDESCSVYDPENPDLQCSVEKTSKMPLEGISQANRTRGSITWGHLILLSSKFKELAIEIFHDLDEC